MIFVNGISKGAGKVISVVNNRVIVDGKDVTPEDSLEIYITVEGDVDSIDVPVVRELRVVGNVKKVKTISGNVNIEGNILEDVETVSGNVSAEIIEGNIKTVSGDIKCKNRKKE